MKYLITIPALCLALAILALAQINEVLAGNFPVETVLDPGR